MNGVLPPARFLAGAIQDNGQGNNYRDAGHSVKVWFQEPVPFCRWFWDAAYYRPLLYPPQADQYKKPYNNGFDKYYDDLNERYNRGEFEVSDSIHFFRFVEIYHSRWKNCIWRRRHNAR